AFCLRVFGVYAGLAFFLALPEFSVLVAFFLGSSALVAFFLDSSVLAATFFFGVALAVCWTVSGRSTGPVKTTTGGTVSTGGPSTNLAGFALDSMKAGPLPLFDSLPEVVDACSSGSSLFFSDGGFRRWPPHISSRRLGGCASIGANASTVPSEGVSQDRPPLLNPRSSNCAAFCARTAPDHEPSTTAISLRPFRVADATTLYPE